MNGCVDFTLGTDGFATSKGGVSNLFPQRAFPDWCPHLLHPDSIIVFLFCIVFIVDKLQPAQCWHDLFKMNNKST